MAAKPEPRRRVRRVDVADRDDLSDERGWLYGILPRDEAGHIPDLGTWGQQIAEFPLARSNDP